MMVTLNRDVVVLDAFLQVLRILALPDQVVIGTVVHSSRLI